MGRATLVAALLLILAVNAAQSIRFVRIHRSDTRKVTGKGRRLGMFSRGPLLGSPYELGCDVGRDTGF